MSVNKVIVLGRLGQDPELKHTAGGSAVTNFSVATSESWTDKQGEKQERTEWHRVVVWGKLAEICSRYLNKGRQVYLEGRLQTRSWEDTQGQKRYTTEVQANSVEFLGGAAERPHSEKPTDQPNSDTTNTTNTTMLNQSHNVSTDANFTSDNIPF